MSRSALALVVAGAIAACASPEPKPVELTLGGPAPAGGAPTARLAGKDFRVSAYLWRDFMPVVPPQGPTLIALVSVTAADSTPVPAGFKIDSIWVINGNQVWATTAAGPEDDRPATPTKPVYEVVAREGPRWEVGALVDVVARLRAPDGTTALLRIERQPVNRVE